MNRSTEIMRKLMGFVEWMGWNPPDIRVSALLLEDGRYELLSEGKWVNGRFQKNIRIDKTTHLQTGDLHAHVLGRKGDEIVVVNLDGSASHGSKGKLHNDDADALRLRGFKIRADNIVEWWLLDEPSVRNLLLG